MPAIAVYQQYIGLLHQINTLAARVFDNALLSKLLQIAGTAYSYKKSTCPTVGWVLGCLYPPANHHPKR